MTEEDAKKNLKEIVKLTEPEIEKNDENVHAILDSVGIGDWRVEKGGNFGMFHCE